MSKLASQNNIAEQQQINSGDVDSVQTSTFPSYKNRLRMVSSSLNQPHSTGVMERQLLKQNKAAVPSLRTLTPANVRHIRLSKTFVFNTSLHSKSSIQASTNSWKSGLVFPSSNIASSKKQARHQKQCKIDLNRSIWTTKEDRRNNRRLNRRVGCICSRCCCLASIPLLALLLIGFGAMIFGLSKIGQTATTITTMTTSAISASTISTSSTTSTSSATTITTTTSESMTVPEWNATMQCAFNSRDDNRKYNFFSSQKCSTDTTTTANSCGTPTYKGSASNLFSTTSSIASYTCEYFEWISPTNGSVNLTFQFRNDPSDWYMDDVSVSDGTAEMLLNGGFESGSLLPNWIKTTPNGNCFGGSTGVHIVSSPCHTGTYCIDDGCNSRFDQISQSFVAIAGQSYFVSFWLKGGGASGVSVNVTLS